MYLNNQRQGTAQDQDPELRLGRQPEALEAEGHRPRAAGLDPRPALAGRRHRVRPDPARLPHRHPAQGEAAGPEERAQRPGARGRAARGGAARLPRRPKTAQLPELLGEPRARRAEGAGAHGRRPTEAVYLSGRNLPTRGRDAVRRGVGLRHPLGGCGGGRGGRAHRRRAGAAGREPEAPISRKAPKRAAAKAAKTAQDREGRQEDRGQGREEDRRPRPRPPRRARPRPPRSPPSKPGKKKAAKPKKKGSK